MRAVTSGDRGARRRSIEWSRVALAGLLCLVSVALGVRPARAADKATAATCIQANEEAGPLRRAGKLREARARLRLCSAESCPLAVRKDCLAGAAQADLEVPTVGFSVQGPDGNDLSAVTVSIDGQPLVTKLDGKAIDVDPGPHVFRFEAVGQAPVEKTLVIVEGEKNRRERIQVGTPIAPPAVVTPVKVPAAPTLVSAPPNPRRALGLGVGGAGLGLLAAGAAAGLVATLEWSAAKNACGPTFPVHCSDGTTATSNRSATVVAGAVADVALGLGAVAVVTGAVLVLLPPPPSSREGVSPRGAPSARLTLAPQFGPTAGGFLLRGTF